jgi:RHS repeat-associated protein
LVSQVTPGNQTYFYHYDGVGSTIAMTDSAGNVVNRYAYDAFGKASLKDETVRNPFQYAGGAGVIAERSGLLYMGARYYDPQTGRFLSQDPAGLGGGLNLYAYTNSDPINFIDPEGQIAFVPILVGIGIGAGGDFLFQLIRNGGDFDRVNWCEVAISGGLGALGGAGWARLGLRFSISSTNFGIVRPGYGQIIHVGRHTLPMSELKKFFGRKMAGQLRPHPLTHLGVGRSHYPLNPLLYLRKWFGL